MVFLSERGLFAIAIALLATASPTSAQDGSGPRIEHPQYGETATQRVRLEAGPNLVSLFVRPASIDLEAVFGDGLADVISVRDGAGRVFSSRYDVRTLDQWSDGQAYVVHAENAVEFDVSGDEIKPESAILLDEGWNAVAFLNPRPMATDSALASIAESLDRIEDADGRVYPAMEGRDLLDRLTPGAGYRVHLARPDTLVYASLRQIPGDDPPNEDPPSGIVAPTLEDALALTGLAVGDRVVVEDPVRGGAFVVTNSGAPTDGGTVFVPAEHTSETTASNLGANTTLYDGPNDEGIVFESFRLYYGPSESDYLEAMSLHGNTAHLGENNGKSVLDTEVSRILIPAPMRDYTRSLTGSDRLSASYRYATSPLRLERVIDPIVLEGVQTTNYVRPEWWGAVPYPETWTPDTSAPPAPGVLPSGIVLGDPVYDATDRLATAMNAAERRAAATGQEQYLVLGGMYGYGRVLETQQGVVIKGERDGVRNGQGLRILKGAPWHYWEVKPNDVDSDYFVERSPVDRLLQNADPFVTLRHGRDVTLSRLVDVEIDGNLAENEYVVSDEYQDASGAPNAPYGFFKNRVEELLQNTAQWNGFVASHQHLDMIPGTNVRLENVHIHDVGGNTVLGNNPVHFGGSHDLLLGNNVKNHHFYGVYTDEGTVIDGIEIYGFSWNGLIQVNQGHYRNLVFRDLERNPYFGYFEDLIGHRTLGVNPARDFRNPENAHYYFGDETVIENVRIELPEGLRPSPGAIYYSRGPFAIRGLTIDVQGDDPLVLFNDRNKAQDARSRFELSDVTIEAGEVRALNAWSPMRMDLRNVSAPVSYEVGESSKAFIFRPLHQGHVATISDVGRDGRGPVRGGEFIMIWPRNTDPTTSLDLFVQRSTFEVGKEPIRFLNLDPLLPSVQERYRIFWRDVKLSTWKASNGDSGISRASGKLQYFENVTVGGRTSENAGTLSYTARGGETAVDVEAGLFWRPQDPSYVSISGPDAALYSGEWEAVGEKYNPTLRLALTRALNPGETITLDWSAAIRPIPDDVVFPD